MSEYPNPVDTEERPEFTPENIPDEILEEAISTAVIYRECPHCGERQFMNVTPGYNRRHTCADCGEGLTVVG